MFDSLFDNISAEPQKKEVIDRSYADLLRLQVEDKYN